MAMTFKREWDSKCPRVWDQWEAAGVKWVIQDLPPEDEKEALEIMRLNLIPDEVMNICSGVSKDPVSEQFLLGIWQDYMQQRMSLACYSEVNGVRTLVALNVCYVRNINNAKKEKSLQIQGDAMKNIFGALLYIDGKLDLFKHFGYDSYFSAMGLVVKREHRGAKLGSRLLAAREPLCRAFDLKATATLFTGVASQKSAARAGFTTVLEIPLKELADVGLNFPRDERIIKMMVKKYE